MTAQNPTNQPNNVPVAPTDDLSQVLQRQQEILAEEHQMLASSGATQVSQPIARPLQANNQAQVKEFAGPPLQPAVGNLAPAVMGVFTPSAPVSTVNSIPAVVTAATPAIVQATAVAAPAPRQTSSALPPLPPLASQAELQKMASQPLAAVTKTAMPANTSVKSVVPSDLKITSNIKNDASISDFLDLAENKGSSDLHISTDYPPMLRIDGNLVSIGAQPLEGKRTQELLFGIMTDQQIEELKRDLDIDFSYTHKTGTRFRVNVFVKKGTYAGAFRLIPSHIRTIAELGLPKIMYDFTDLAHGLVLITGPTGSGKSTTIASVIQEINLNYPKHIVTLEDPIEYLFPKAKALVNQREIGRDATSWTRALREVLREDPDVVLVGEMRDYETIAATITAAETGHLVFSTLHTNTASQTVDRLIDVFPDAQQAQIRAQLANVIAAVVSQRLIPVNKGGRKAVIEILIATPAVRNAIREAKTYQIDNMIQTNSELGMITLEKSLIQLIRSGEITLEQAQAYTTKPDELISLMKNN